MQGHTMGGAPRSSARKSPFSSPVGQPNTYVGNIGCKQVVSCSYEYDRGSYDTHNDLAGLLEALLEGLAQHIDDDAHALGSQDE